MPWAVKAWERACSTAISAAGRRSRRRASMRAKDANSWTEGGWTAVPANCRRCSQRRNSCPKAKNSRAWASCSGRVKVSRPGQRAASRRSQPPGR